MILVFLNLSKNDYYDHMPDKKTSAIRSYTICWYTTKNVMLQWKKDGKKITHKHWYNSDLTTGVTQYYVIGRM